MGAEQAEELSRCFANSDVECVRRASLWIVDEADLAILRTVLLKDRADPLSCSIRGHAIDEEEF